MNATALDLVAADGVRLSARWWTPPADAETAATVVLAHGFGASCTEPRVGALASTLASQGHPVLTYDARGHGESEGETTLGAAEALDVAAAVEAAGPGVVLVGASMGAISVLHYAARVSDAERSALRGLVLVSCPARWRLPLNARGVLSALMTMTPPGRWFARRYMGVRIAPPGRRPAPPVELVRDVRAPLVIVHGTDDPFIPADDAKLIYEAANEPRRLELVDRLGHAFEQECVAPVIDAVAWLDRQPDSVG